jgi:hypothetical protein
MQGNIGQENDKINTDIPKKSLTFFLLWNIYRQYEIDLERYSWRKAFLKKGGGFTGEGLGFGVNEKGGRK